MDKLLGGGKGRISAMSKIRGRKIAGLVVLLAATLLLSSCYMQPDKIADDDALTVGNNTMPFESIAPLPTATVTPTPPPAQAQTGTGVGQVNWDDWGTTNATQPPVMTNQPVQTPQITTPPQVTTPPSTKTTAPSSNDSGVLRSGSSGDAVERLQQRLKDLGYYTGSVDGDYGAGTVSAVEAFQSANGLGSDGIAGAKTQEKLYSYYAVSKPKSSGTNSTPKPTAKVTSTPKPTATPNLSNARYLKLGMSGSDVRQVQNRLISLGYLAGSADGDYGSATEAAIKAFQKKAKIWDDGIAGPDTQQKLFSSSAPKASSVASAIGESLKEGMNGDAVRALQKQLINLGYLSGTADGDFGANTKKAVIAFQQNNGLTADGVAGSNTLNKLYSSDAVKAGSTGTNTTAPVSSTGYTTLREGDSGDKVKVLQQKLKDLGYYTGTVDGKYGTGTITAVQAFQTKNGLTVDGIAGPTTQRMLFGDTSSSNNVSGSLKLYDEGANVKNLQYTLYELGYYQDAINGIYGQSTSNAVREFQIINGLTVDGVAGNATLNLLYSSFAKPASAVNVSYKTLMKGDEGEEVAMMQARLYDLGYMVSAPTGIFDDETFTALKSFQQYNSLTVDGIAGASTQEKIYSETAVRNPIAI